MHRVRYRLNVVLYLIAFVFANLLRFLPNDDSEYRLINLVQYLLFVMLVLIWAGSSGTRLRHPWIRVYHGLVVALICMKLLLRATRHILYPGILPWERLLWYSYYIPDIPIPYISWLMTQYVGRAEDWRIDKKCFIPIALYFPIVTGILTNELHGLAFRIDPDAPRQLITRAYDVSFFYYAAQIFMFSFAILAVIRLHKVCRMEGLRSRAWMPIAIILAGILYTILYALNLVSINGVAVIEASGMSFLATIGTWEACLASGLIPNNRNYDLLFLSSDVPMQIMDHDGIVYFKTTNGPLKEDAEYRAREYEIPGGVVSWKEDITEMMRSLRRTEAITGELSEANRRLSLQAQIKRSIVKAQERSRLYSEALEVVKKQEGEVVRLIGLCRDAQEERQRDLLALVAVYAAFIKRRSNLVLISRQASELPVQELHFCLKETSEALAIVPVGTSYHQEVATEQTIKAQDIMQIYDEVQAAIERVLPRLEQAAITLVAKDGTVSVGMMLAGEDFESVHLRWQI